MRIRSLIAAPLALASVASFAHVANVTGEPLDSDTDFRTVVATTVHELVAREALERQRAGSALGDSTSRIDEVVRSLAAGVRSPRALERDRSSVDAGAAWLSADAERGRIPTRSF